jgi:hypothetical protein
MAAAPVKATAGEAGGDVMESISVPEPAQVGEDSHSRELEHTDVVRIDTWEDLSLSLCVCRRPHVGTAHSEAHCSQCKTMACMPTRPSVADFMYDAGASRSLW